MVLDIYTNICFEAKDNNSHIENKKNMYILILCDFILLHKILKLVTKGTSHGCTLLLDSRLVLLVTDDYKIPK